MNLDIPGLKSHIYLFLITMLSLITFVYFSACLLSPSLEHGMQRTMQLFIDHIAHISLISEVRIINSHGSTNSYKFDEFS